MKTSLLKLGIFSILPILFITFSIYLIKKNHRDYYERFSSPQQNSFILGSSRAATMDPHVMDSLLYSKYPESKLYNYAFTWAHSPFGPKYLQSIQRKLVPNTKGGIFIITVEPTAVMVDKKKPDSPEYFIENDKFVAKTRNVASNPNFEYLYESYEPSISNEVNLILRAPKNIMVDLRFLANGKNEVTGIKDFKPSEKAAVMHQKMIVFDERLGGLKKSKVRMESLQETIRFLKQHGVVIVLRMPISKKAYAIEEKHYPTFDQEIEKIVLSENCVYTNYNLIPNNYDWSDEVHLDHRSIKNLSIVVAQSILNNKASK